MKIYNPFKKPSQSERKRSAHNNRKRTKARKKGRNPFQGTDYRFVVYEGNPIYFPKRTKLKGYMKSA